MTARNNRQNHDFQILHFMVGQCHTPDGAYALLCDLYDDRNHAIRQADAAALKKKAKRLKLEKVVNDNQDEIAVLEASGELAEMEAGREIAEKCYQAALDEVVFIKSCMDKLEPYRQYKHLSLREAHEAAQYKEWLGELKRRAENYLLLTGTIPADEFNTMRSHPEFGAVLLPHIEKIRELSNSPDGAHKLLQNQTTVPALADMRLLSYNGG